MRQVIDEAFLSMLEGHDLQVKNPMHGLFGGNRRSKAYGSSAEFADFREYAPGDDLRRIDWNLYARFEKLYLKLFVDERQLHHKIYLDTSASMDWGEPSKADTALKLAAALGFLSVQAMDRVSFYAINENRCENLCQRVIGKEAFYAAADILNQVEFHGDSDLNAAITQDLGNGDGISVIISDFLTDSDWKSAVDRLRYHEREVYLIQVLSPDELAPGMSGKVMLLDAEALDIDDSRNQRAEVTRPAMKAYAEALQWLQRDMMTFCAARQVGYVSLCTNESIEKILFRNATEAGLIL